MLKNVKLKKFLKSCVFPVLSVANKIVPKSDDIVLLYSPNLGIEHNLKPLRDYMIKHNYHKRYRIICSVVSEQYFEKDGLKYVKQFSGIMWFLRAKHVYYTTGQVPIKPSKDQIVVHMDHGTTAVKTGNLLSKINNGDDFFFTYYCAPSPLYVDIVKAEFNCQRENIVINSEPVTDIFYEECEQYDLGDYQKIGLWMPTFRQSDYLGYDDSAEEDLLPTLKPEDYESFNTLLKNLGIKLIIKLHDMQDLSKYDILEYSNLEIYSGKDFSKKGYNLYKLMKQSDFILADYSSVFLQYLLLDRPMGFVIPDFEDYKEKRGFVFENVQDYMPGSRINTKEELFDFLKGIANGEDHYAEQRKRVNDKVNYYQDGKSCERLITIGKMK